MNPGRHLAHSAPDCCARTSGACRGIPWSATIVSEGGSVHVGLSRLEDSLEQGFGLPPIRWRPHADPLRWRLWPHRLGLSVSLALASLLMLVFAGTAAAATAPRLGTNSSFAILGGSAVTNTGPSVINGNLGVNPTPAISGFPPGIVNGVIHSANAAALQAQTDLTTAYNDAAGQPFDATVTSDLGGQMLTPGTYRSSSSQ